MYKSQAVHRTYPIHLHRRPYTAPTPSIYIAGRTPHLHDLRLPQTALENAKNDKFGLNFDFV